MATPGIYILSLLALISKVIALAQKVLSPLTSEASSAAEERVELTASSPRDES